MDERPRRKARRAFIARPASNARLTPAITRAIRSLSRHRNTRNSSSVQMAGSFNQAIANSFHPGPKRKCSSRAIAQREFRFLTIQMDPRFKTAAVVRTIPLPNFLVMGVNHIWTGYDHFCFIRPTHSHRNFASSFKTSLLHDSHSITLAVATLSCPVLEPDWSNHSSLRRSFMWHRKSAAWRNDPKGRWLLTFAFA